MRKILIIACLFISISHSGFGQRFDTTKRVETFIKVWGFLKYHHPLIATGTLDWDSVFTHSIQGVISAGKPDKFNAIILDVMNAAGRAPQTKLHKVPDSLFDANKTSSDWIKTSKIINSKVRQQLLNVYDNRNQDTNRYIKIVNNTADFSGENKFGGDSFTDVSHRLLFLSRFWNIINYFAPYKYLTTNWDGVLEKFIPEIIQSNGMLSYYTVLQQLSRSLHDGHSQLALNGQWLTDLFFGKYIPPFYCDIIAGNVVIRDAGNDSTANAFNIRRGDIILKVDGEDINKIIDGRRKYISASNQADENHQLSRFILDGQLPEATLEIKRGTGIIKTAIRRASTQNRDWRALINYTSNQVGYEKLNDSVLLIYAMQIWNGNLDTIKQLIKHSKAVIFDVRNYPQNDAFFYIADPFLSEPKTIDYSTIALPASPGLFKWHLNPNKIGHVNDHAYKGKVVILCDERTQSQGEYSCMVLQTIPGSVTIGSQTAGADGVVTYIPMGGGLTISYSGYGVYYPDKTQTQQVGVKIDFPVRKTMEAVQNNRDEILERALLYISSSK